MPTTTCPICTYSAANADRSAPEILSVRCPGCGRFEISDTLVALFENTPLTQRQRANASGWLRGIGFARLMSTDEALVRSLPTLSIPEKADRLMQYLAKSFPDPGSHFSITFDVIHRPIMSAIQSSECEFIAEYCMSEMRWLRGSVSPNQNQGSMAAQITPEGWAHIAKLAGLGPITAFGFVAMHFDTSTDRLRETGIKPAILSAGYDPRLIDEVHHVNHVDDEILAAVRRSRFVLADLTGQRQNVYYEAGFAQGLGKPVFWSCNEAEIERSRNHFDVRQYAFVLWREDAIPDFQRRLTAKIVGVLGPGPRI